MHAMLAITGMVDGMAIVGIPFVFMLGTDAIFVTQTASYGVAALFTWIVMSAFLEARGVMPRRIWRWPADEQSPGPAFLDRIGRPQSWNAKLGAGAALGVVLGVVGVGYGWLLWRFPQVAEQLAPIMKYLAEHPQERWATVVIAVGLAPIAEEYLFRGLLFRALDREWGGWRAVIWSAVFFGVYHPPLSWLPVGLVGVVLALLFKASGSLWPCIVVHAVYNAIVTLTM